MYKIFLDTNILIYSYDIKDPKKNMICRNIIGKHDELFITVSTQVLQEFFVVSTKKLKADPIKVKMIIHESLEILDIILPSPQLIEKAIDISVLNIISFWDALIVAAALEANCDTIISENFCNNQIISGIKIINPFLSPEFK